MKHSSGLDSQLYRNAENFPRNEIHQKLLKNPRSGNQNPRKIQCQLMKHLQLPHIDPLEPW